MWCERRKKTLDVGLGAPGGVMRTGFAEEYELKADESRNL